MTKEFVIPLVVFFRRRSGQRCNGPISATSLLMSSNTPFTSFDISFAVGASSSSTGISGGPALESMNFEDEDVLVCGELKREIDVLVLNIWKGERGVGSLARDYESSFFNISYSSTHPSFEIESLTHFQKKLL